MNDNSTHGFTEGSDIPNSHTELTSIGITYYQIACETIRDQEKRIKELEATLKAVEKVGWDQVDRIQELEAQLAARRSPIFDESGAFNYKRRVKELEDDLRVTTNVRDSYLNEIDRLRALNRELVEEKALIDEAIDKVLSETAKSLIKNYIWKAQAVLSASKEQQK